MGSVLLLANQAYRQSESGELVEEALENWLDLVPAQHLPVLWELARENLPGGELRLVSDGPLTRRIAALMSKEEAAALRRQEPALFNYLRNALLDAGLVSMAELEPKKPGTMTDRDLAESWDRRAKEKLLPMDLLEEAMRRGLPWAKMVVVELIQVNAYGRDINQMIQLMASISDCPTDHEKARRWLRRHAARMEWDPATKRWVVPPPG